MGGGGVTDNSLISSFDTSFEVSGTGGKLHEVKNSSTSAISTASDVIVTQQNRKCKAGGMPLTVSEPHDAEIWALTGRQTTLFLRTGYGACCDTKHDVLVVELSNCRILALARSR